MKIEKIKKQFTDIGVKMAGKGFKVTQVPKKIFVCEFDNALFSFDSKKQLTKMLNDLVNDATSAYKEEVDNTNLENFDNAVTEIYDLKVTLVKRKRK